MDEKNIEIKIDDFGAKVDKWTLHTWIYLLIVILMISVIYELFSNDMRLWKRYFKKR